MIENILQQTASPAPNQTDDHKQMYSNYSNPTNYSGHSPVITIPYADLFFFFFFFFCFYDASFVVNTIQAVARIKTKEKVCSPSN
jgi:hypothetical protein